MFGGVSQAETASLPARSPPQSIRSQSPVSSLRSFASSRSGTNGRPKGRQIIEPPFHQKATSAHGGSQSSSTVNSQATQWAQEVIIPEVKISESFDRKRRNDPLQIPMPISPAMSVWSGMESNSIASVPDAQVSSTL